MKLVVVQYINLTFYLSNFRKILIDKPLPPKNRHRLTLHSLSHNKTRFFPRIKTCDPKLDFIIPINLPMILSIGIHAKHFRIASPFTLLRITRWCIYNQLFKFYFIWLLKFFSLWAPMARVTRVTDDLKSWVIIYIYKCLKNSFNWNIGMPVSSSIGTWTSVNNF